MSRVVYFEIHAEEPQRAMNFYEAIFGWGFQRWEGPQEYYLIKTGPNDKPGIDGGLIKRMGAIDGTAVIAYVCTIDTESVDEVSAKVWDKGGQIVVPKMAVPGVGWLAYCKDTEGNIFGIMQEDRAAQ
jgi:uncharacterized protein